MTTPRSRPDRVANQTQSDNDEMRFIRLPWAVRLTLGRLCMDVFLTVAIMIHDAHYSDGGSGDLELNRASSSRGMRADHLDDNCACIDGSARRRASICEPTQHQMRRLTFS